MIGISHVTYPSVPSGSRVGQPCRAAVSAARKSFAQLVGSFSTWRTQETAWHPTGRVSLGLTQHLPSLPVCIRKHPPLPSVAILLPKF